MILRCGPGGVLAGGSFRTDAVFNGIKELEIELSAVNVSRALGLGMRELKMSDAFSPVLFKDGKGAFMASMPLRQKAVQKPIPNKEESPMTKQSVTAPQQPQAPAPVAAQGFNVVHSQQPNAPQADPFEDLVKSAEEVKGAARASYEAASQFTRKLRELQASLKRKEREQKSTRELIEKLKTASGF